MTRVRGVIAASIKAVLILNVHFVRLNRNGRRPALADGKPSSNISIRRDDDLIARSDTMCT